jgi:hypothetical protein
MPGATDYTAVNVLNYLTGQLIVPALPSVWLGLFTTAPTSDSGVTGATEVSGGSYARVQVAGQVATTSATSSSTSLNMTGVLAGSPWLAVGMSIRDVTTPANISAATTIASISTNAVVMSASQTTVGSGDQIRFSAFGPPTNSSGAEPNTTAAFAQNNAIITFPQASASWGTVVAFGLFDAVTSGNCLAWDWLGNYKWIPSTVTAASPGVWTMDATTVFANGTTFVVTGKYGTGTFPVASSGSLTGINTSAGLSGNTFTVTSPQINISTAGEVMLRQVLQQPIAINVTASFAQNTLVISDA